jgi:hypothetical protein
MLDRAQERDVGRGGRFQIAGDVISIWPSAQAVADKPMGSATLHHNAPDVGWALIYDLHWNPAHGGSEAAVRQALNELIGSELL